MTRNQNADEAGPRSVGRLVAVAFVIAQAAIGLSNLAFHVLTSRLLGPAAYGELGALLALVAVLAVPATTVETLVTARVAQLLHRGEPVAAARMMRCAAATGLTGAGLLLVAGPALQRYLGLSAPAPAAYLALYCVPLSAAVVPWGLLCGQRRLATAGGIAFGSAVLRLALAVLFIGLGYGVAGAVAASVCSDSVRAILLTLAARGWSLPFGGAAAPLRLTPARLVGTLAPLTGLWLLIGTDSVLARHTFAPVVAGQYNAAAAAARSVYFVAQGLCLFAVPAFASGSAARARAALRSVLLVTAALGTAVTTAFAGFGSALLQLLFGPAFRLPPTLPALLGLQATALAVLWVAVQYRLARGPSAWIAWPGLAVAVVGGTWWATRPLALALVMIAAAAVALAGPAYRLWRGATHAGRPVAPPPPAPPACTLGQVPPDAVDLTVVVPFHNPGAALRGTLLGLLAELRTSGVSFEIVAVADGCTDGSPDTIADLDPRAVRCLVLARNSGKGAALRLGLQEGRGRYLGFIDADGDLDPHLWQPFLALMRLYEPDAVIGAKYHPLSEVNPGHGARRWCSLGYRTLVRLLFPNLRLFETQVGIKVFRRRLLADVLPRTVERGFVFDLELLAVAHRLGYRRLLPAPVRLHRAGPSTVTVHTVRRMFIDTVALAWRVWCRRAYDAASGVPDPARGSVPPPPLPLSRLGFVEVW